MDNYYLKEYDETDPNININEICNFSVLEPFSTSSILVREEIDLITNQNLSQHKIFNLQDFKAAMIEIDKVSAYESRIGKANQIGATTYCNLIERIIPVLTKTKLGKLIAASIYKFGFLNIHGFAYSVKGITSFKEKYGEIDSKISHDEEKEEKKEVEKKQNSQNDEDDVWGNDENRMVDREANSVDSYRFSSEEFNQLLDKFSKMNVTFPGKSDKPKFIMALLSFAKKYEICDFGLADFLRSSDFRNSNVPKTDYQYSNNPLNIEQIVQFIYASEKVKNDEQTIKDQETKKRIEAEKRAAAAKVREDLAEEDEYDKFQK